MRFPSDDELMAGPNAFGDARIEVAPDAADPEADARAQIEAGLGETSDEAGAESVEPASSSAESGAPAEASPTAPEAPAATPDLLTDAEQISEDEIDAGRTAALKKMLEERGKQ